MAKFKENMRSIIKITLILLFLFIAVLVNADGFQSEKNVFLGVRISFKITKLQMDFVNNHFDYIITPFLKHEIRKKVKGLVLLLYRSIRGTWTGFNHFDWDYINSNENMFYHHNGRRIKTIYNSWLMNGEDFENPDLPDSNRHWIDYYAREASKQVYEFKYDGLFIDSAGHRLWRGTVKGNMPDGYSAEKWRDARYKALKFIKKQLPDKFVVFNGLHSDNGAELSLSFTDGGMWETFAFNPSNGRYYGKEKWKEAILLAEKYGKKKFISIVSKKNGFSSDVKSRMFVFASYLFVSSPKVILYISDLKKGTDCILYYPEYNVKLGKPLGDYFKDSGIYIRRFERGMVLVNPDAKRSYRYRLDKVYNKVIPAGGGVVKKDGTWKGHLNYKKVSGKVLLRPLTGVVLKSI